MSKKVMIFEKREALKDAGSLLGDKGLGSNPKTIDSKFGSNLYVEGENYILVSAAGHLYTLEKPERIDPNYGLWKTFENDKDYSQSKLIKVPIKPDNDPTRYRNPDGKKMAEFRKRYLSAIGKILERKDIEEIIFAADADDEGERIAADIVLQIYDQPKYKHLKDVKITRFYNPGSFKAKKSVEKAMTERESFFNKKYQNLYNTALSRAIADYLVGMKLTKVLTEKYGKLYSNGRVQSVIIGMIGRRENEIKNFKEKGPKKYWQLNADKANLNFKHFFMEEGEEPNKDGTPKMVKSNSYFNEEELKETKEIIENENLTGIVKEVKKETKEGTKPRLYNTGDFQNDYMGKFGGTVAEADGVLEYLRNEGYTTYPRTDGNFYSTDDIQEVEESIELLKDFFKDNEYVNKNIQSVETSNKIFNNKKAPKQNHTPLNIKEQIPTKEILSKWEKPIVHGAGKKGVTLKHVRAGYEMIAKRILIQFLPNDVYETQKVVIDIKGKEFELTGEKPINQAYREIVGDLRKNTSFTFEINKNEDLKFDKLNVEEKETKPPALYTEKTLISTMINVKKALDDELEQIDDKDLKKLKYKENQEIKKILSEKEGIGTGATRKGIVGLLKNRKYIEIKKSKILLTETGWTLYEITPDELQSLKTTATWENELEQIRLGELTKEDFLKNVDKKLIEEIIPKVLTDVKTSDKVYKKQEKKDTNIVCPFCNSKVQDTGKAFRCSKSGEYDKKKKEFKGCKFQIFKNSKPLDREINESDVNSLLKGETLENGDVKVVYNKDNPPFFTDVDYGKSKIQKKDTTLNCPICEKGILQDTGKAFRCSESGKFDPKKKKWSGCGFQLMKYSKPILKELEEKDIIDLLKNKPIEGSNGNKLIFKKDKPPFYTDIERSKKK